MKSTVEKYNNKVNCVDEIEVHFKQSDKDIIKKFLSLPLKDQESINKSLKGIPENTIVSKFEQLVNDRLK